MEITKKEQRSAVFSNMFNDLVDYIGYIVAAVKVTVVVTVMYNLIHDQIMNDILAEQYKLRSCSGEDIG